MEETVLNVSDLLRDRIGEDLLKLQSLEPGTPEYTTLVDSINTLYDLMIKETSMFEEADIKRAQQKQQRIDKIIDYSIRGAGIVLPLVFYGVWMKRGFEFEKDGIYTSMTFKGLINKFKPTKVD